MTSSLTLTNLPRLLWDWYVNHLWNYERGSWVDSAAKSLRVLAWLTVAPFIFFIMLDVASYTIARTLGVIDDTKASTSDRGSLVSLYDSGDGSSSSTSPLSPSTITTTTTNTTTTAVADKPASPIESTSGDSTHSSGSAVSLVQVMEKGVDPRPTITLRIPDNDPTNAFADGNLRLSGVGVFSPAVSRASSPVMERTVPPSPIADRAHRGRQTEASKGEEVVVDDNEGMEGDWGDSEGAAGSLVREASWGSLSMDSSFTIIDGDSGSEDVGAGLRRRLSNDGT